MALAVLGATVFFTGSITSQVKFAGLFFGMAFCLALWSEIAKSLPIVFGVLGFLAILAVDALRLGWESVPFMLLFLAIWHLAATQQTNA